MMRPSPHRSPIEAARERLAELEREPRLCATCAARRRRPVRRFGIAALVLGVAALALFFVTAFLFVALHALSA